MIMRTPFKILITDSIHQHFIDEMKSFGCEVHYLPEIKRSEVLEIISGYQVLLINSRIQADKELLEKATQLKAVARIGSGLEVIDLKFAGEKNIACFNAPEGNKDAVAEHALGMLLCLLNNIHIANAEVKNGLWQREKSRGTELGSKTIGIIGYGSNGSAFAEKLKGLNVNIIAYDKYKTGFGNQFVNEVSLDAIFMNADILSIHIPLTAETHHLVNDDFINRFAKPFYFINVSRGKNVHTEALIKNLLSKKILGACLDVLENERLETLTTQQQQEFRQLQQMSNVIITPHIAGWTHESKFKITQALTTKLQKYLSAL
jgi:D-3-phosphoglycerate dehydrogenase / 2-oxoglutarate reductase